MLLPIDGYCCPEGDGPITFAQQKGVTLSANFLAGTSAYATSGFAPSTKTEDATATTSTAETCSSSYHATVSGVKTSNHSYTHTHLSMAPTTSYSSTTSPKSTTGHTPSRLSIMVEATATATVTILWSSGTLSGRFSHKLQVPLDFDRCLYWRRKCESRTQGERNALLPRRHGGLGLCSVVRD